jgi:hypothetical protein
MLCLKRFSHDLTHLWEPDESALRPDDSGGRAF